MSELQRWFVLCRLDELPIEGARGFDLAQRGIDDVFIVRKHAMLRCYRNACPHWPGATLPWRRHAYLDGNANYIVCHGHGARFEIGSGLCVLGPCSGARLEQVSLRIDDTGAISIAWPG